MNQGWVYVLLNASMPGCTKVGRTHRPTAQRAQELSSSTGVPTPFMLAFEQEFADCVEAERLVHAELDRRGARVSQQREFFRAPVSEIIRIILELADEARPPAAAPLAACAEQLRLAGEQALTGTGPHLQDTAEALRLFRLAISRGSISAYERLGQIYASSYFAQKSAQARRRATAAFKQGARSGNYYCYAGLADLYASDLHKGNFAKAWALFFSSRAGAFRPELEQETDRYAATLTRYIGTARALGISPRHLPELQVAYGSVSDLLLRDLDGAGSDRQARWRKTMAMQWCFEALAPPFQTPRRGARGPERLPRDWIAQPRHDIA